MRTEAEIMDYISTQPNIIVYGAKDRAKLAMERINEHGLQLSSELFVAVSNTAGEAQMLCNVPVVQIDSLANLADKSVVLIATQPKFHDEITQKLSNMGFSEIVALNDILFHDMASRHELVLRLRQIQKENRFGAFIQSQTMNEIRLNHLRHKVEKGNKARVTFLVTSPAHFFFSSVYRAMEEKGIFDVSLFVFAEYYNDYEEYTDSSLRFHNGREKLSQMRDYANNLQAQGFKVVWGYDDNDEPLPVEDFSPDIIFYNTPNLLLRDANQLIDSILHKYLCCYIPYGLEVANSLQYHFENEHITPAWIQFVCTKQALNIAANKAFTRGTNLVYSGHPALDDYTGELGPFPDKIDRNKKTVVYAPHWSIATYNNLSTFHLQYKYFIEMLRGNPDINFVFKPHPLLEPEIKIRSAKGEKGIPSYQEWQDFCHEWQRAPNGVIFDDSKYNYIDLFRISDLLITDSISFILIWLATDNPCFLLMNPCEKLDPYSQYYPFIRPVLDSYYICRGNDETEKMFQEVLLQGKDSKRNDRLLQKSRLLGSIGKSGQNIADYIERQLLH